MPSSRIRTRFQALQGVCVRYLVLWESRRDLVFTLLASVYALVCFFCVCLANAYADRVYFENIKPSKTASLPDPGMVYLNKVFIDLGLHYKITDVFVGVAMMAMLVLCVSYQTRACQLLRRVLIVAASLYLLRAPTIVMTVLPNPNPKCEDNRHPTLIIDALLLLIQHHQACGDIFFSGHTIPLTLALRMYLRYTHHWVPKLLVTLFAVLGMLSLVMSALHYSIDVLYSALLTSLAFSLYHWTATGKLGRTGWFGAWLRHVDHPDTAPSWRAVSRRHTVTTVYTPTVPRGVRGHGLAPASLLGSLKDRPGSAEEGWASIDGTQVPVDAVMGSANNASRGTARRGSGGSMGGASARSSTHDLRVGAVVGEGSSSEGGGGEDEVPGGWKTEVDGPTLV